MPKGLFWLKAQKKTPQFCRSSGLWPGALVAKNNVNCTLHTLALLLEKPAREFGGGLCDGRWATFLQGHKEGQSLGGVDRKGVVYCGREEQKGGKRNENTNQDWVVDRFVCLLVEFKGKEQSNIP